MWIKFINELLQYISDNNNLHTSIFRLIRSIVFYLSETYGLRKMNHTWAINIMIDHIKKLINKKYNISI